MPARRLQSFFYRYGLAAVSVCVAMAFTRLLRGIGDSGITPLFFAAVLLSAWYGGLGPGVAATFLSSVATAYLILKERGASLAAIPDHILRLIVFAVVSVITSSLHGALRRAAESSRKAREAAEAANEAKSRFIAMVSHELRTPLGPVLMMTQFMENDPSLPPAVRNDIRTIRRNVDLEIRLIDDLVDLTRISAGKLQLREAVVDVCTALNGAIDVCRDDVREHQLELITEFAARDSFVNGDPVRLQQVFWNLIRNAVKFTPEGGIIRIRLDNGVPDCVVITIADNGIGIDPRRLVSIFREFDQGDADIQTRFGGMGLGLAICQAMVEAHHGTIRAASDGKGKGATFIVTLPLVKQPVGVSREAQSSIPAHPETAMQIKADLPGAKG
ncbi:MAG TPA: HAMP domain-containing sensor histidine kinase [Tepidisphaeraceae bacterium]|nr:HAMP domain-containing sensor histidine kinase [Tepidisphaeraceae bacterium]